jgi:hypothetical protein
MTEEERQQDNGYFIITDKGLMYKERERPLVYEVEDYPPIVSKVPYTGNYKFIRNANGFDL